MAVRGMWNDPTHPGIYNVPGISNQMIDGKYKFSTGNNARGQDGLMTRPGTGTGAIASISQRTFLADQSGML